MKREAMGGSKMKSLSRHLNLDQWAAVGILESLWHLTAREAPQGDVGKLSNADIAAFMEWRGDPDALIQGLVNSRWLDVSDTYRLVVHDWHEHADEAVKKKLDRAHKPFLSVPIDPSSRHVAPPSRHVRLPGPGPGAGADPGPDPGAEPGAETPPSAHDSPTNGNGHHGNATATERDPDGPSFQRFREVAEQYGMRTSETEWRECQQFPWKSRDRTQKEAAVKGLLDRLAVGDRSMVDVLPKNYISKAMYERNIRAPASSERKRSATEVRDSVWQRAVNGSEEGQ
jgi:hypothetical protein